MSSQEDAPVVNDDRPVIYINIVVLDPKEMVKRKVKSSVKASTENMPKPVQAIASKVAPSIASKVATPDRVASVMADLMPQKLPEKLSTKGITAVADTVFCEPPFVVVQLQIQGVKPLQAIRSSSRDHYDEDGDVEKAKLSETVAYWILLLLGWFFRFIGAQNQFHIENKCLPDMIQPKIESAMGELLLEKLDQKGLEADAEVLPETKQARFFFEKLKEIRKAKKEKHPIARMKRSFAGKKSTASVDNSETEGEAKKTI